MRPPARVSSKRRMSASLASGPGRPSISRRPTSSSRVTAGSSAWGGRLPARGGAGEAGASWIKQVGPAGAGEASQVPAPRALEAPERAPALDGAADGIAPAQQIDGQPLSLELVGWAPPAKEPRLAAGLDDQREVGREGLEAPGVGDVELDALAELPRVLVEGGLKAGGSEGHAGHTPARQGARQAPPVEEGRADQLERARRAASLGQVGALDQAAAGIDARRIRRR